MLMRYKHHMNKKIIWVVIGVQLVQMMMITMDGEMVGKVTYYNYDVRICERTRALLGTT